MEPYLSINTDLGNIKMKTGIFSLGKKSSLGERKERIGNYFSTGLGPVEVVE